MARGNYNSGSIWASNPSLGGKAPGDTLEALTVIGEGLARIGGELARLGDGAASGGGPVRTATASGGLLPWDGFDPDAGAASAINALDGRVGDYIQRARTEIEALADWESSRPDPRATVLQATRDWLSRLDEIGPTMWRQT
jgi:hypothetical protein